MALYVLTRMYFKTGFCSYTLQDGLYNGVFLHILKSFTLQTEVYTAVLLYRLKCTLVFYFADWSVHWCFTLQTEVYTGVFLCRMIYTRVFSFAEWFIHKSFPLQNDLYTSLFLCRMIYTQVLSFAEWFIHKSFPLQNDLYTILQNTSHVGWPFKSEFGLWLEFKSRQVHVNKLSWTFNAIVNSYIYNALFLHTCVLYILNTCT